MFNLSNKSFSAIAVAAAHGQRSVRHKLLSHPVNGNSNAEVLSLEEILAEGASQLTSERRNPRSQVIYFFKFMLKYSQS